MGAYTVGEKAWGVAESGRGGHEDDGFVVVWMLVVLEVWDGDSDEVERAGEVYVEDDGFGGLRVLNVNAPIDSIWKLVPDVSTFSTSSMVRAGWKIFPCSTMPAMLSAWSTLPYFSKASLNSAT